MREVKDKIQEKARKLLCKMGFHCWEKEPTRENLELLRSTGIDFFFFTTAIQIGKVRCTRHNCDAERLMYREGICGAGGSADGWKKCSPEKAKEINSLPVL
jgi:hypothetical protein